MLAATFSAACAGEEGREASHRPRPIIIIDIDTLRADHLGCYGYHRDTSPNIDALAAESTRFEWAFSQAPNTPPSQTSILTSLYPSIHGMIKHTDRVPQEVTTLAEALADQGFGTAAFVDGGYMSPAFGLDQGFEVYEKHDLEGLEVIGPKVIKWVRRHASETFLLLVHTYDVHTPYDPPEPFRSMFLDGLEQQATDGFENRPKNLKGLVRGLMDGQAEARANLAYAEACYDGGIRYVDEWIGTFLDELDDLALLDRATILLLSDHGDEFFEHGSVLHTRLYATVTRIPLLIRRPGGQGAGVVSQVVESIDIMPTVLELAGAPLPPGIQGRSLLPLMRGESSPPYRAFGESPFYNSRRFVVRDGHQLLWTRKTGDLELYDLHRDPLEQTDLADAQPERTARLRRTLRRWQKMIDENSRGSDPDQALDPETEKHLRALGYLE